jgi:hypothetical protein
MFEIIAYPVESNDGGALDAKRNGHDISSALNFGWRLCDLSFL